MNAINTTNLSNTASNHAGLAQSRQHIPGWGSDIGRRDGTRGSMPLSTDSAYSVNGQPTQQAATVEILTSTERDGLTPVFGTSVPPAGLSGMCRRVAFKFSENDVRHWLLLLLADRVNVGEGLVCDVASGHIPNLFVEMGAKVEWQHNKRGVVRKAAVTGVVLGAAWWMYRRHRKQR